VLVANIRTVRPSWDAGLLVVCRKCDGYTKSLRRDLREALKARGLAKRVRVVESTCLDVCPKRATTVVLATPTGSDVALIPNSDRGAEALALFVRRFTKRNGRALVPREPFP